jgi:hypothetical protein
MSNAIEVAPQHTEGAKINLTIDLAPEDCFIMCKQLFDKLKDDEKDEITKERQLPLP